MDLEGSIGSIVKKIIIKEREKKGKKALKKTCIRVSSYRVVHIVKLKGQSIKTKFRQGLTRVAKVEIKLVNQNVLASFTENNL